MHSHDDMRVFEETTVKPTSTSFSGATVLLAVLRIAPQNAR